MDGTDSNRLGLNLRGDGTSASSNSGSPSPDFLRHHNNQYNSHQQQQLQQQQQLARKDIEVTGQEADHLHSLQVRRGSEPALNCISPGPHSGGSAAHLLNEPSRDYKVQQLIVYCFFFFLFAVAVARIFSNFFVVTSVTAVNQRIDSVMNIIFLLRVKVPIVCLVVEESF